MSNRNPYPTISESQQIGRQAESAFAANRPATWIDAKRPGSDDFGIDYDVTVAGSDNQIRRTFRAQLKGTLSPQLVDGGSKISVRLKASNARFYEGVAEPILLIVCDLTVAPEEPARCPLHYVWLHEELRRVEAQKMPDSQEWVNVRVPRSNRLTFATDILAHLDREALRAKAGGAIARVLEGKWPDAEAADIDKTLAGLPRAFDARSPTLFDALMEDAESPWPEPPRGSIAWRLAHAGSELAQGDLELAVAHLDAIDMTRTEVIEAADLWVLRGKVELMRSRPDAAARALEEAFRLLPTATRAAAWAEAEAARRRAAGAPFEVDDLVAKLAFPDAVAAGARARVLAAAGQLDQAWREALTCEGQHGAAARAIVGTARADWASVMSACDEVLSDPSLGSSMRALLLMSRGNAAYWLHVASERDGVADLTDAKANLLRAAWSDILAVTAMYRKAGWPENTRFIGDAWAGTAIALNRAPEALDRIAEAARARPNLVSLQSALEAVAHHSQRHDIALIANAGQPSTPDVRMRRVLSLYAAGRMRDCATLFAVDASRDPPCTINFGAAATMAGISARRLGEHELFRRCRQALAGVEGLESDLAALDHASAIEARPADGGAAARAQLELRYHELDHPSILAKRLLNGLNVADPAEASKAAGFAGRILEQRALEPDEVVKLGRALIELSMFDEVLALARRWSERCGNEPRLQLLTARAFQLSLRFEDSLEELRSLIAAGFTDSIAFDMLADVALRLGRHAEAREALEMKLARASTDSERFEVLAHLWAVECAAIPGGLRQVDIAWRMGEVADRMDEAQEARFLACLVVAGTESNVPPTQERHREFLSRRADFRQRFPEHEPS